MQLTLQKRRLKIQWNVSNTVNLVKGMVDDLNNSLPILKEYGYQINKFEIELGVILA